MGWQTDQPVIGYLERRIKYYEKQYRQYRRYAENPRAYYSQAVGNRMSIGVFKKLAKDFAYKKSLRIAEYKYLISILKDHEKKTH